MTKTAAKNAQMTRTIDSADEACKVLMGLMETPQIFRLHFEFDVSSSSVPVLKYEVERFVWPEDA